MMPSDPPAIAPQRPDRPALLLAAPMGPRLTERLAERAEIVGPLPPPFAQSLPTVPAALCERVRVISTIGLVAIGAAEMQRLPSLGLIACLGSGYEGVDLMAARARGITVTHSPIGNASSVADMAIALMIESVRAVPAARRRLYDGTWKGNARQRSVHARGLTGRKLGIYGLGTIGRRIALRALAMEMEIGYHARHVSGDVDYRYFADLHALAQWADVLMVAVRAAPINRHAVDASVLAALGAEGHVVNIARGSVIDEAALIDALQRGTIAGAGLDVYEHEPDVPAALLALANVALTPHIAGNTIEAAAAGEACMLANVDAYLASEAVPTPVPQR